MNQLVYFNLSISLKEGQIQTTAANTAGLIR